MLHTLKHRPSIRIECINMYSTKVTAVVQIYFRAVRAKYSQHGIIKSMKWTHSVSTDATVSIDMIVMWLHNSKMAELPVMWIYFNSVFYCFVWCIRIPSKKAYFSCSCSKQTNWATCCDMSRMSSPCRIVRLVTPTPPPPLFNCIHRIVVSSHLRWRCSYVMRRTWLRVS